MRPLVVALCLALPTAAAAQPKTIEIEYDEQGRLLGTKSTTHPGGPKSIRTIGVRELPGLVPRRAGAATLLVLWATHCRACRAFLPTVSRLRKKWRKRGLTALALSLDEDPRALQRYVKRFRGALQWLRLRPYGAGRLKEALGRLGVSIGERFSIPLLAVFDGQRRLVVQRTGATAYRALDRLVARLLSSRRR